MGCWGRTRLQDVVQLGESACRNGEKGKMQEVPGYQISHLSCPMRCLSSQARLVRCLFSRTQFTLLMPSIINPYNPYTLHNTAPYVRRKPSKAPMYPSEPLDSHINSYPLLSPPTFLARSRNSLHVPGLRTRSAGTQVCRKPCGAWSKAIIPVLRQDDGMNEALSKIYTDSGGKSRVGHARCRSTSD